MSVPTVRSWVEKGVLTEALGLRVHAVTAASLGRVLSLLEQFDSSKPTRGQLTRLADEIRDRDLLDAAKRLASGGASPGRRFAEVTDVELAAL